MSDPMNLLSSFPCVVAIVAQAFNIGAPWVMPKITQVPDIWTPVQRQQVRRLINDRERLGQRQTGINVRKRPDSGGIRLPAYPHQSLRDISKLVLDGLREDWGEELAIPLEQFVIAQFSDQDIRHFPYRDIVVLIRTERYVGPRGGHSHRGTGDLTWSKSEIGASTLYCPTGSRRPCPLSSLIPIPDGSVLRFFQTFHAAPPTDDNRQENERLVVFLVASP